MGKIKSWSGLLSDGGQDRIRLESRDMRHAWRIVKFSIMPATFTNDQRSFLQIWREKQDSPATAEPTIDLGNYDQLGIAYSVFALATNTAFQYSDFKELELFNNDIFITHTEDLATGSCNYILTLEEVKISPSARQQLFLSRARRVDTAGT